MVSLFQFCVLLLFCGLRYNILHDDCPLFFYITRSIYISVLPFLMNWNEKLSCKSNLLTIDHELVLENSCSAAIYVLPNTIIYFKAVKYLNIRRRRIYQVDLELKRRVRKNEDRMLYYGCKDLGLLYWKLKMLWKWLFLFS